MSDNLKAMLRDEGIAVSRTETANHIEALEAEVAQLTQERDAAVQKIPRFPGHMEKILAAKNAGLPERLNDLVRAISAIPDHMKQYQWQADKKQAFGSKYVRSIAGDNGKGMGLQAIAEVVGHLEVADYIAAANPDTIALLIAELIQAQAASAAAYEAAGEVAAEFVHRRLYEASMPVCSYHSRDIKTAIRALATPDQTAALDRVRAEAKAEGMREALEFVTDFPLGADGPEDGNDRVVWALENIRNAIIAAIAKTESHD